MIKINELRKTLIEYLGHNDYQLEKLSMKNDGKKGYRLIVHGNTEQENRKLPVYGKFENLTVYMINDEVKKHWLSGRKPLGFRTYELIY